MSQHHKHWPQEWEQGVIKTANAMGVMFKELSPAAEEFVQFAKLAKLLMLDIWAAFGVTTIPALENGANVIACDLSDEHLVILRQSVDKKFLHKLQTVTKKFPDELNFNADTIKKVVEKAGFTIDGIGYFCYKNYPDEHRTDGNEFIGLFGTKSSIIDKDMSILFKRISIMRL